MFKKSVAPWRSVIVGLTVLLLAGCASGYSQFYQEVPHRGSVEVVAFTGTPTVLAGTGDPQADVIAAFAMGLVPIGVSSFNGPNEGMAGALAQAKKVGASHLLVSAAYARTVSGAIPITVPQTYTTQSSGTVSTSGPRGFATGTYSGTSSTTGSSTSYIPYSVDRYDQQAVFLAPLDRGGVGFRFATLTTQQASELGTNKAVLVEAVRRGSPAFLADILPGDYVLSVNGAPIYDQDTFTAAVKFEQPLVFAISRGGEQLNKTLTLGPGGHWQ